MLADHGFFLQTDSIVTAKPFTDPCLAMAKDGVDSLLALLRAQNAARVAPQPAYACVFGALVAAAMPSTCPWLVAARAQNAEWRSRLLVSAAHTGS